MTCVKDAFRWVEHNLAILERYRGRGAGKHIAKRLSNLTVSSSFSGVGGAENALNAITKGVCHFYGEVQAPVNEWACEWFDESRYGLRMIEKSPWHVFSDITDFIAMGHRLELRELGAQMSFDALARLFMRSKGLVVDAADCTCCGKMCKVRSCELHVAGTHCVAWSIR